MCWFLLGWRSGAYHFGSLWPWHWLLTSFLGFSCLKHITYITANFPQMCFMLDQFLWGHSSRDCDISCSACPLTCYTDCTTVYFVKGVIRFWCLSGEVKVQSLAHFCTKMLTDFNSISACPLTCYIDCTTVYFVKGVIRFWCLSGEVKVQSLAHFCTKMLTDFCSISACPLTCYIDCTTVYFVKGVIRLWCLSGGSNTRVTVDVV